jgi:hypothetical protein
MERALEVMIARLFQLADQNEICEKGWVHLRVLQERFLNGEPTAYNDIFEFLRENVAWVFGKRQITFKDLRSWFTDEELANQKIYCNMEDIKGNNDFAILFNSSGYFTGHSRVYCFGESSIRAFDQCFVTSYDHSIVAAKDCMVFGFNNSTITMNGYGKVEAWDQCNVSGTGYSYLIISDDVFQVHTEGVVVRQR